jgi:ERF superfamily
MDERNDESVAEQIQELREEIRKMARTRTESDALGNLSEALSKAQGDMRTVKNERVAHYGKYADLAALVRSVRGPLSSNGLSYIQRIVIRGSSHLLLTRLCHSSGEWIESAMHLSSINASIQTPKEIQAMGSAITYLRRYCLLCIVGAASSVDDDDGEGVNGMTTESAAQDTSPRVERITDKQTKFINQLLNCLSPDVRENTMKGIESRYGIDRIADIPKSAAQEEIALLNNTLKSRSST